MAKVSISPRAKADLIEIWEYIAIDSEPNADDFITTLDGKVRMLAATPNAGRVRDELATGIRSFPVGRYVIFYRVIPGGIDLVRVIHGSRDLDALF